MRYSPVKAEVVALFFNIKGFAMDNERLKNPQYIFGKDYFEEQFEEQFYHKEVVLIRYTYKFCLKNPGICEIFAILG